MTTFLKILLATSLIAFLASLTEAGSAIAWGFLKPLSAILFGVFFIGQLLQKEMAKYDKEFRLRMAQAKAQSVHSPASKALKLAERKTLNSASLAAVH